MRTPRPGFQTLRLSLRHIALSTAITLSGATLQAQDLFSMSNGSGQSCQGVLFDSGGQGATGYQNGENYTFTLCPDVPGNVIYLTFSNFDLDQSGPQNSWDNLSIYDGDNTSATFMGSYTGDDLQNVIVSGTVFNLTGCLTLVFQSNGTGTGVWAAGFSCTIPCQNPLAVASMSEPVPALVCQGESVSFDGSASYAQPGYTITQYLWDFDDGTVDSTSGAVVDHVFTEPGEHVVQLYLTDDNGCKNLNLVDQQVLVSTTPSFALTSESQETCLGATVSIYGEAEPVTWTGIPDANFGDGVYLPDDVGLPFSSSLNFQQFDPGQTVTNVSNIESICVDMEHSFMGDLVLQVICPNGQTMILHQQGGSGTFLGSPYDGDSDEAPVQGECWHYCWSPGATNGTWVDNSSVGGTPNTLPSGEDWTGQALAPGTYEPVQSFNNLIGCPLNGEWTYQSTDLWGADNGFICAWEINFDPAIIPDVTTFTPSIGSEADSSQWEGGTTPDYVSADGDTAVFTADTPGDHAFVYTVTDNFGCTYDTTITVTVNPAFNANAGPDQTICNNAVQLSASVQNSSGQAMSYTWSPPEGLSNPNTANPSALPDNTTTYTLTAYVTGHPECSDTDEITISLDPGVNPGQDTAISVCMYPPSFDMVTMLGGTPNAGGTWVYNGQPVPAIFDPTTSPAGVYTYTVTSDLGCSGSADLTITLLDATDPLCCGIVDAGPEAVLCQLDHGLTASIGNTGTGSWSGPAGYAFANASDPQTTVTAPGSGAATFYWIEDDGILCYLIDSVTIIFTEPLQATVTPIDAVCFQACDGSASVAMTGGNGEFTYAWSGGNGGNNPQTMDLCAGTYQLAVTDTNGCATAEDLTIGEPPLLEIDGSGHVEPWCNGDCNGSLTIIDTEAVEFSFNGGSTWLPVATLDSACAGVYDIAVRNADGCIGTGQATVTEPPAVVAEFTHLPIPANIDAPTIDFRDLSAHAVAWVWDIAGQATFTEQNPRWTFSNKYPGVYDVCLVAINDHGCRDSICHEVTIDNVLQTYIPNSFTPDGNGVNDTWWMVRNMDDVADFDLRVFDRWGQTVFESSDPNIAWDGTLRNGGGEILKEDVYAYRCTFRLVSTAGAREYLGHVTLLK